MRRLYTARDARPLTHRPRRFEADVHNRHADCALFALALIFVLAVLAVLAPAADAREVDGPILQEITTGDVLRTATERVTKDEELPAGVQRDPSSGRLLDDVRFAGAGLCLLAVVAVATGAITGAVDDDGDFAMFSIPLGVGLGLMVAAEPIARHKVSRE